MAARTRIWALESCSRSRSSSTRRERSAVRTTRNVTSSSPANTLSSTAVEPGSLSPEKKSDSRMTAPKSAIEAAASTELPELGVELADDGQRERNRPAQQREPQQPAAELCEVHLQTGEEEQIGEPDQGEHLDGLVHLDPAQHRRADHDAGDYLEDDRRQPRAWNEPIPPPGAR
jgi:hypothetical protein